MRKWTPEEWLLCKTEPLQPGANLQAVGGRRNREGKELGSLPASNMSGQKTVTQRVFDQFRTVL